MSICRRSVFTRPRRTPLRCQQLSISSRLNSHRKIVWKCGATAFCPVSGFSSAHSITARHSGFGHPRALHFSFMWRRCVGVFLCEVGIYQLAEQSPGVLGVLVLLRLRRSAQVGSPRQFLVQRSALLCSVHGINFDFLVIRGVLTCAAQEAALTLKRFCAHTLPFCISRKVLLSVGG